MKKEILINAREDETRTAIVEDDKLVEIYVERPEKERMVGDIYKGRVAKVLPGLKASFVSVGLSQDAFLHFSDIAKNTHVFPSQSNRRRSQSDGTDNKSEQKPSVPKQGYRQAILNGKFLSQGSDVLVQIVKEPIYSKGARVTTGISIPGRYTVLIPNDPSKSVGVSKKIHDRAERRRLRHLGSVITPKGHGLIVRTNAENISGQIIHEDIKNSIRIWEEISAKSQTQNSPTQVYKDMEMVSSVIRDQFSTDVSRVLVDDRKLFKELKDYANSSMAPLANRIEFYRSRRPI